MALAKTTLAAAVAATDIEILLTAITGVTVGTQFLVDNEGMRVTSVGATASTPVGVFRGIRGTNVVAHVSGANVVLGPASDFGGSNVLSRSVGRQRDVVSYSAAGALTLPTPGRDMVAILNGTTGRAMTLAVPSKDNDGDILIVVGNGKATHSVSPTGGIGASALAGGTFDVGAQCSVQFVAANEVWVPLTSPMSGTLTTIDVAVA